MTRKICFIAFLVLLALSEILLAQGRTSTSQKQKNHFKMSVDVGVYAQSSTSTTHPRGNEKITDNTGEGDSANFALPLPLLDLRYIFGESKTQLYFGTPIKRENHGIGCGIIQPIKDIGVLTTLITKSVGMKIWEDPYEEGTNRKLTSSNELSIELKLERIANSPLLLAYTHKRVDVDEDAIGELNSGLKRDGVIHYFQTGYVFSLNKSSRITSGVTLKNADLQGTANRHDQIGFTVDYMRFSRTLILILKTIVTEASYAKSHPLYDKTRKESGVGLRAIARIPDIFDINSLYSNISAGVKTVDSNIDFFDSRTVSAYFSIGYAF